MVLDLIDMDFFSHPSGGIGRNVINFGVDMSSSTKIDIRKKKYFNSWQSSYIRIRTYTVCRKSISN